MGYNTIKIAEMSNVKGQKSNVRWGSIRQDAKLCLRQEAKFCGFAVKKDLPYQHHFADLLKLTGLNSIVVYTT